MTSTATTLLGSRLLSERRTKPNRAIRLIKPRPPSETSSLLAAYRRENWCMQPSRIKVLKFITTFAIAGTERQFMNLGRSLDPFRFDLHFACFKRLGHFLKEIEASRRPLV